MKRYLLFTGYDYYPSGGWGDYVGNFDTIEECKTSTFLNKGSGRQVLLYTHGDWWHIIDTQTMEQVASG